MTPAYEEDRAHRLSVLIGSLQEAILLENANRQIELVNEAFCQVFGIPAPPAALVGADCSRAAIDSAPLFANPDAFVAGVDTVLANRRTVIGDVLAMADGRVLERDYIPIFIGDTYRGHLWKYRDVTARVHAERRQQWLDELTQSLVGADTEADAYTRALATMLADPRWRFGAAYALQQQAIPHHTAAGPEFMRAVAVAAAPGTVAGDARAYDDATRHARFARGEGLPGRVWAEGRAALFTMDTIAEGCERLALARRLGWSALALIPVRTPVGIIGVIELAATTPLSAVDAADHELGERTGERVGRAVERLRARHTRRATEAWARMIVDQMMEGLIVVDDDSGCIALVNPTAETMFGYGPGELTGLHISTLVGGASRLEAGFLQRAYREAFGRTTEWTARRKNGDEFPMELQLVEFDPGDGRRLVGFVRDLSERLVVDRLKKEFIATVSHELRTPVTAIRASLGLLEAGHLGPLPPEAREVAAVANRSAVRLIGLINDILDLERAGGAADLVLSRSRQSLDGLVARAVSEVTPLASETGVRLDPAVAGLMVDADGDRVAQVLVNLLSNAIKYSPMGECVEIRSSGTAREARVEVLDRGPGVPDADRDAIFEPFRRVEAADNRRREGSGLGLAICRAIIQRHGGDIGYVSREGGGSVFWFTIPRAGGPAA